MKPTITFETEDEKDFKRDLDEAVRAYLALSPQAPYAPWFVYAKGLLFAAMALLFYALLLSDYGNRGQSLVYGIGFSFSMFCLITNISHEAAHGVLCRSPRLNSLIHSAVFSLSGVNARLWKLRHNAAHHPFPNVPSCDADVDHNPVLKLHPDNRHYAHFRFQHLYAPFAYIVGMLHAVIIQDIIYLRKNKLANLEQDLRTTVTQVTILRGEFNFWLI
jgi:linoleoyl-CoA desaturase